MPRLALITRKLIEILGTTTASSSCKLNLVQSKIILVKIKKNNFKPPYF